MLLDARRSRTTPWALVLKSAFPTELKYPWVQLPFVLGTTVLQFLSIH